MINIVTQEMKNQGISCRGKGFNCPGCKDRGACTDYTPPTSAFASTNTNTRPPLGIVPKKIWDLKRIEELKDAINRYLDANKEIPIEWIEEYNSFIKEHKGE